MMLVILLVLGVFLLWLGTELREINRAVSILVYVLAITLLLLGTGGFFQPQSTQVRRLQLQFGLGGGHTDTGVYLRFHIR